MKGECYSYQTAEFLAMETDEKRKERLEMMVATTQLSLALETEEERRAKNGLDLIWI